MNVINRTSIVSLALLAASASGSVAATDLSGIPSGTYVSDPTHAYVNFKYNHLGFSNPTLSFDEFSVSMDLDNADPTKSSISVSIDPASIISGSEIWKEHLTGDKWFDVANHPEITFQSTAIEANGDGYKVMGDLTIKGVSKQIAMDVAINGAGPHPRSGDPILGIEASGQVLRSDFGMGGAAPAVSDEVSLGLTVEMGKAK